MDWSDDPIFEGTAAPGPQLGKYAAPAFRVSLRVPEEAGHILAHTEAYEALFALFRPILERDCTRLYMIDKPGRKQRRRTSIKPEDWEPFRHLKSVAPDAFGRSHVGFYYQSGVWDSDLEDHNGPAMAHLFVAEQVSLELCIPVADWTAGAIDADELRTALLALPLGTTMCGFGMMFSDFFDNGNVNQPKADLHPIACKYPALDLLPNGKKKWFAEARDPWRSAWLAGVNWLTGVGEPFLGWLGGPEAVMRDLPPGVQAWKGQESVLFQIGESPISGLAGQDDADLASYHALGERLRPQDGWCLTPGAKRQPYSAFGGLAEEEMRWRRRFFFGAEA